MCGCVNVYNFAITCDVGADVGYEDFIADNGLKSGAASVDLANPAHIDPEDRSRSYAVWVLSEPMVPAPQSWFFLMPDVGLAIELWEGVVISWDGRVVRHCTSVQQCDDSRQSLYSLFYALPKHVGLQCDLANEMKHALTMRHQIPRTSRPPWRVGDVVWVRWSPCASQPNSWVRRRACVGNLQHDGMIIKWCSRHSMSSTQTTSLPKDDIENIVTHAGAIDARMYVEQPTLSMIGKQLKVYVCAMDEVCEGVCSHMQLDSKDAHLELTRNGNTIRVRIYGFMNPPMCVV